MFVISFVLSPRCIGEYIIHGSYGLILPKEARSQNCQVQQKRDEKRKAKQMFHHSKDGILRVFECGKTTIIFPILLFV